MCLSLLGALATAVLPAAPATAAGAGTVLFQNAFNDRTVDGTGSVTVPAPTSGTNGACLTASGNLFTPPLTSCAGSFDLQGSGKLRLTGSSSNQVGGVFGQSSFPSSSGLDVTFNSYQWGGTSADGIAFMLAAVDPTSPVAPTTMGPPGGSLGYARAGAVNGLTNAYLGVALDVYGNFTSTGISGTGCAVNPDFSSQRAGAVSVRGPGTGTTGYCGLATTSDGTPATKLTLHNTTRANSVVPVQVLVNPTPTAFTSPTGVSVAAGTWKVVVTPVAQTAHTLSGNLPAAASTLYPSPSWVNASGVPKQLAFGFVGSTGSLTDNHEISDVKVLTFNPVPQLSVSAISYAAATSQPGDPVNYTVTPAVGVGADEASPISMTQTAPVGVVPVGAYGTGWVCQAPVGRSVTCTTSSASFPNGVALSPVHVVAIVTGTGVTSSFVQGNSTSSVTSLDAGSATDLVASPAVLPTAPSTTGISPSSGLIAGGASVTITGTNFANATAVEIGTATEQTAGTPVVLLPCPGGVAAPGCFTLTGTTSITVSSWPARASIGSVNVNVVTHGQDASIGFTYVDTPGTPAAPTATAGITSAVVSWVAPAANGSPITGYKVTPYLGGVAQAVISYDASTTTRTITGLTAGGVYTFTVSAVNANGTSPASPKSAPVVPYSLPGAPTITAVSAGTNGATLTFTAPGNGGSAITGYVVTPYIGATAQASQSFTAAALTRFITGLTAGTAYTFTVAAQNLAGTGPASARSSAVTPNVSPSLTFPDPVAGEVGAPYSRALAVTNGTSPFVWSVSAGALPDGLTLNSSTGLLSGTPTVASSFSFTVRVTDASGETATRAITVVIAAAPTLTFTPAAGEVSVPYSQQPTLAGGTGPFAWSIVSGSLPPGVTVHPTTGLVSGTPTSAGTFAFGIQVVDSFGQSVTRTVSITVVALPTFVATAAPAGKVGVAYSHPFDVVGGTLPLTWSIGAGSLPPGLTLNAGTGVVSGVPTTIGSYPFTVSVVDARNQTANKSVTAVIAAGPLVITKTADVSSAAAGGTVAYTVTITNTGNSLWTGATLSDPLTGVLDDAVYNADATASSGSVSYTSPTLGWTGNVAAGATVTITYSVKVNSPDVGNKVLANTVTSSTLGANCAAGSNDNRCTATVTVAGLTIVKTADVGTTNPGGTVHYSIVVTNAGQSAYTAATLTDNLAGTLDDAVYNGDGATTSGSVSFAGTGLTWTGGLAVGASATITYSVTVADPDAGNRSLTGTVTSSTQGSPCPAVNPAAQCTTTVTVLVPALVISNTAGVSSTTPGAQVPYTITLSNTGQTAYSGVSARVALAAVLDDATYDANAVASAGSVTFDAATSSLVWTGSIPIGAVVTITASVTVRDPDTGNRSLSAVASSTVSGSTCPVGSANPACTSSVTVLVPGLTITKTADVSTTTPGSVVRYTTSVTNTGQTPYTAATFSEALGAVLDDATYGADAAASAGTVSYASQVVTWTGDLAIGATANITYSVTVRDPDQGNRTLTARAVSSTPGSNCAAASTDALCVSNVAVLLPGLDITQTVDATTATPGQVLHYDVNVHNSGQTAYSGVAIRVDFGQAFDDATYNSDVFTSTGSLIPNPDNTSATWILDLAPGQSANGTMSLTVNDPVTGDKQVRTSATSNAVGSTCPTASPGSACNTFVQVLVPRLTIAKSASTSTTTPGGVVGYTIVVTNNGETPYPAANFSDDLSHVLLDATYAGDASTTAGSLSYSGGVLSWVGALAPGATATVTYSVTIRDPDPGDKVFDNAVESTSKGSNCPAGGSDPLCAVVVTVNVPALTIVSSASPATTTPGATVQETIKVTNTGATSYAAANLSDTLAGVLDDATYDGNAAATSGTVGVTAAGLTWSGALAPGASTTITFSVTVHAADGGNNVLTSALRSTTTGNTCPAASPEIECTTSVPVARLVLNQAYENSTTTPGSVIRLNGTFTNTGQVPYTGITISSPSAGTTDDANPSGDQTATSGTLTLSPTQISWTGSIPVGGVVNVTGTLTVKDPDTGDKVITGTLVSAAPGNNCPAGGHDSRCTALITVKVPRLTITKSADTSVAAPGGTVGYTITVQNSGESAYVGASVTDTLIGVLDDATLTGAITADVGSVAYSTPVLTWTGDLAIGESATISYTVLVGTAGSGDKSMVNPVSSTTPGSTCPPASGSAACSSRVTVLTPALVIVKTADHTNATLGTTIGYTIIATNTGQTTYSAATFTDSLAGILDDATYGGDAAATGGTVTYDSGVLSWSGPLAPGDAATITYTATINRPATGDRDMANSVASDTSGNNCAGASADPRCTADVAVTNSVSLTFEQMADVATTTRGDTVGYTITVVNSDTSPANAATFTLPLGDVLDDANYNGNANADLGAVQLTGSTLTWTGNLGAGSTATITYSVTVHGVPTGDQILSATVSSTSLPASNNCVANSGDPRCASAVPVAALLIHQEAGSPTATPGSVVHLTQTFTNTGKVPYFGVSVVSPRADTADDTIANGDQVVSSGTLVRTDAAITWTGDIPVGGVVTSTRSLTVKDPDPGNKLITATLASNAQGSNCPPAGVDPRCTFAVAVQTPELTIVKSASSTFTVPGGTVGYTITVHNTGETAYAGAVVSDSLSGVLDDAVYNENATTNTGELTYSGPVLTWTGDLAGGATATITYSVTAHSPATGDKTMVNPVSSTTAGSTCPPASGSAACHTTVAVLTPALTISSVADHEHALPGQTVTYTVVATNSGQLPFGAANLQIPLADVLDDATYPGGVTANRGTVAVNSGSLTWSGALSPGLSVTITYTVVVGAPGSGNFRLGQTVTSTTQGTTCPVSGSDPRCTTSVPIAGLRIVSTTDVAESMPTGTIRYTSVVTNIGQVPYEDMEFDQNFVEAGDDLTYDGDASATSGSLLFNATGDTITWTGDLGVGGAVTVTGSGTVNNPDLGDHLVSTVTTSTADASNCPVGGVDPRCETNVPVRTPGLTITTSADTTTTTPGSTVGYTITIHNTGQTAYTGATVTDSLVGGLDDSHYLDDAAYVDDAGATTSSVVVAGSILTWTGDLEVDGTAVVTYSVRVDDPDPGDKVMVSIVDSDELGSSCPSGGASQACRSTVLVLVPVLDISLTPDRSTTIPGETVGYVVSISNTGQVPYPSATVETVLAGVLDDAAYVAGSASSGLVTFTTPNLTWTGDVAIGQTVVVSFSVRVDDPDAGNRLLSASVSSSAPGSTCGTGDECSSTVPVLVPGLLVSMQTDMSTARPGDVVALSITVHNTGQTPYNGTVVTTSLTDVLDDAAFDGGVEATTGIATYDAPTISWTGSLAVGASVTIAYDVTVRDPDPGDQTLSATVVAQAVGSTCPAGSANPLCTVTVDITVPQLTIAKTASSPTVQTGSAVGYTILVTNTGETAYTGAQVRDSLTGVLSDSAYNDDAVATSGSLAYAAEVLTWTGNLAIGASASITYSVTVDDPDNGDKRLINTATSTTPGSTCRPATTSADCTAIVRVLVPSLLVTKVSDTSSVVAGDDVQYTITLLNDGQTDYVPAQFTDSLAGVVDDASYNNDATADSGSVELVDGALVWTGPLAMGASAVVTYSVSVDHPVAANPTLTNTVVSASAGSNCGPAGSDPRCLSTVDVLIPGLEIHKTADTAVVVAGGTVHYTISATNTGQADYAAAVVVDSLAGVLDDASYDGNATASTGTVTEAGGSISWQGELPRQATVVVTYSVSVPLDAREGGNGVLTNSVASDSFGSTCPSGTADPDCSTSTSIAAQTLTLSGLTSSFTLAGQPDSVVTLDEAVSMTVTTNSVSGYQVSVQARQDTMTGQSSANTESIPIDHLSVRESGTSVFATLSATAARIVHQQSTPSAAQGDAVSSDFRVDIPFVPADTYSVTLDYIATTQ